MGNMSYCRFENTASDLEDCWENFDDDLSEKEREARARKRIIKLACNIAENYGYEIGMHVEIGVFATPKVPARAPDEQSGDRKD